jgi:hypothetical protein
VPVLDVRVEQADRHGLGLLLDQAGDHASDGRLGERPDDRPVGGHPLVDLEREPLGHRRRGLGEEQVVAVALDPGLPAQPQHVAEPGGGDERDGRAGPLEDQVGGQRGAVDHPRHVRGGGPGLGEDLLDAPAHGPAGVVRRGEHLADVDGAVAAAQHDVRERPPDVDPQERAHGAASGFWGRP